MKRYLKNERGAFSVPFTAFFVLALISLLALIMTYLSAEITFMSIRNTVKNELANVSVRISEDTYKAMSEGNLLEYYRTLTEDESYREELQTLVENEINSAMALTNENYTVDNITLSFKENADCIEYVFTCDVNYFISLFGEFRSVRADAIKLTGKHNVKIY